MREYTAVSIFAVGAPAMLTLVELPRSWVSDLDIAGALERKFIVFGRYESRVLGLWRGDKRGWRTRKKNGSLGHHAFV